MMNDDFLKGADWQQVKMASGIRAVSELTTAVKIEEEDLAVAYRRRLLETERKHYWTQFEQGTIGVSATKKLVDSVEHALDGTPTIGPRKDLVTFWNTPTLLNTLKNIKGMKNLALKLSFKRLSLSYDVARGFIQAQDELESHVDDLAPNKDEAMLVHKMVMANKVATLEYIESLRQTFPEIIRGLETYCATRLLLYRERAVISLQLRQAVLDKPEAERMIMDVEKRMSALNRLPNFKMALSGESINSKVAWLQNLSNDVQDRLNNIMQHAIYNAGEEIAKSGKAFCAIGIITRGTVALSREKDGIRTTNILGAGEAVGAITLLSGYCADDMKATSLVDILWLPGDKLKPILAHEPELSQAIGKLMG